jgi:hypothetical protein
MNMGICRQVAGQIFDRACRSSSVGISSRSPQIEGPIMHISAASLVTNTGAQYGPWYREPVSRLTNIADIL